LNEQHYEIVNSVIQKYENRVAILTNNCCASFCQFCTRQRLMNAQNQLFDLSEEFEYINKNSEIHDVLLTGGDPLTMKNSYIKQILDKLSDIRHVDIIRIGTRVPVTLPMRIDQQLIDTLCQYPALYMNIHVNHPDEITEESIKAICLLTNAGIPLGSQSVLLKHINDDADTLQKLFESLVKLKIKPYYLYQCDQENGCEYFIVSPFRGIELINNINGRLSGLAVPRYVVDTPDMGKLVLAPCNIKSANATQLYLENYKKEMFILQNFGK
jgi:lysine 2,3-aminomutase